MTEMPLNMVISYGFYVVGSVAVFCLVFLVQWYWRREVREKKRAQTLHWDIDRAERLSERFRKAAETHKAALKQLQEDVTPKAEMVQKFTEEFEPKTVIIRQLLEQSLRRNEQMFQRQTELEEKTAEAMARLNELLEKAASLRLSMETIEENMEAGVSRLPGELPTTPPNPLELAETAVLPGLENRLNEAMKRIDTLVDDGNSLRRALKTLEENVGTGMERLADTILAAQPAPVGSFDVKGTQERNFNYAARTSGAEVELPPISSGPVSGTPRPQNASSRQAPADADMLMKQALEMSHDGRTLGEISRELGLRKDEVRSLLILGGQTGSF